CSYYYGSSYWYFDVW
nr:immunoglobulin heavy chain junction region [Mus musculus]